MEWIEVPIPTALASGPTPQVIHYLDVNDAWSVYIVEIDSDEDSKAVFMSPSGPVQGGAKWMIIFNGSAVGSGVLKNIKSAKNVSMTILDALMEGPNPDTVQNLEGSVRRGKGSGN